MTTPLTVTMKKETDTDALVQTVSGGHSSPPVMGGPANVETESAPTKASADRVRLIESSPLLVVSTLSAGHFARTLYNTPVDPASHALWRTYIDENRLNRAAELCRERLLTAETDAERVCWVKDLALVKMAESKHLDAFDLLLLPRASASLFVGPFRARLETVLGRSHENLAEWDAAFEHYTAGGIYATSDPFLSAQIDTNLGRCLVDAGRPEDSHEYFDRAFTAANGDVLLSAEVYESRALALLAEKRLREAQQVAAQSLALVAGTEYRLAYEEAKATLARIDAEMEGRVL